MTKKKSPLRLTTRSLFCFRPKEGHSRNGISDPTLTTVTITTQIMLVQPPVAKQGNYW